MLLFFRFFFLPRRLLFGLLSLKPREGHLSLELHGRSSGPYLPGLNLAHQKLSLVNEFSSNFIFKVL